MEKLCDLLTKLSAAFFLVVKKTYKKKPISLKTASTVTARTARRRRYGVKMEVLSNNAA